MAKNTSQHILGTSANLLGFCLFVITSLHVSDRVEGSLIDEFTSVIALLLTISCFFSYGSIRTLHQLRQERMERWADWFFIASLVGIMTIIVILVFHFGK
ncbi:MAG: hypothetical protein KF843_15185 [Flavobacteriales bacterium]|nr:hypothetical protein [Flavobacteriales bacterium]